MTKTKQIEFSCPMRREEAEKIYNLGQAAVIFVLMELAKKVAARNAASVSTPSGMKPPYEKGGSDETAEDEEGQKKPGAKKGHKGHRRKKPEPDREEEHEAQDLCPDCGHPLEEPCERRFRLVEDIEETESVVTRHSIPRQWCSNCQKLVEPPVPDALPGADWGHRSVAFSAWLHYGLGLTLSRILAVLNFHSHFQATQGGLMDAWQRVAKILYPWYEAIGEEVRNSGVLHGDETGWRQAARTVWLWCFTTIHATYYMISPSRGSPALSEFFTETFDGILVTDFWAAYNAVSCTGRQACLAHLFRELKKTERKVASEEWEEFRDRLKTLLRDGIEAATEEGLSREELTARRKSLEARLDKLTETGWQQEDAVRLTKRLKRYRDALFTFVDHPEVPADNNHAEREIRPAVIMRKNSYCNRSDRGANTQAIFMSIYRTLKLRGHNPLDTIENALRERVRTGQLPDLPQPISSDG
jgi:transposase